MTLIRYRFWLSLVLLCLFFTFFPWKGEFAQTVRSGQFKRFANSYRPQQSGSINSGVITTDSISSGYLIVPAENGTACRPMTREEASSLRVDERKTEMRVITDERSRKSEAQGFKIVLRSTSQLDGFPQAKDGFLRAAAYYESIIQNPITTVIDVDFGSTFFGTPYPSDSVIGATSQLISPVNAYPDIRQRLINGAGNAQQTATFNALPTGSIPTDLGPSSLVYSVSTLFRVLGLLPPVADPDLETPIIGPPPRIGFNSNFAFDFDQNDGIGVGQIDFYATAIHEIGHALGFVTLQGQRELSPGIPVAPAVWDFFRFRPGVNFSSFTNTPRVLLIGGEQNFFAGGAELPLSTGNPGAGGDGRQASHWRDDLLTGEFIGVMDPTAASGVREEITANDLLALGSFGYSIRNEATVTEVLSIDDNTGGTAPVPLGSLIVNRLTPSRYPASVRAVRVAVPIAGGQPNPSGAPLRIVVFNDSARTGQPPGSPQLLFDQTFNIPNITSSRFVEFTFNGPTITSGDIYIGVQTTTTAVPIVVDPNGPKSQRSFISQNNGTSFQSLETVLSGLTKANFLARAVVNVTFGVTPTPALSLVSPNAVPPGGQGLTLFVQGSNFQMNSVVRWNGMDRPTTFLSGTLLQAGIPAGDIANSGSASITVFTPGPGGGDSTALNVNITSDNPVPALARLDPNIGAAGTPSLTINVIGTNFTPNSVVRVGGSDRTTTFISSVQLSAVLQAGDLATATNRTVSVFTPGPAGGTSNELPFSVVACNYSLSSTSQVFASSGATGGVTLRTDSPCGWMASTDVPWITIVTPSTSSGFGKFVISYRVDPNPSTDVRTGTVAIGGQTVQIRQAGLLTSVSAANFLAPLTPEAITAAFGAGLASGTQSATATPLPTTLNGTTVRVGDALGTTRLAPLFFVSPNQVNYQVPPGTVTGNALVTVLLNGVIMSTGIVPIEPIAPGLFSANANGLGVAAAVLLRIRGGVQTFEPVSTFDQASNRFVPVPINFGEDTDQVFLLLFGTAIRGLSALSNVSVKIGDVDTPPTFAGAQGDLVGLDQVNVPLPRSLRGRGEVTINLTVDGKPANAVTVAFQ